MTKVLETLFGTKNAFRYLSICSILIASNSPPPPSNSMLCRCVVCAVEEIEKSKLFGGEKGEGGREGRGNVSKTLENRVSLLSVSTLLSPIVRNSKLVFAQLSNRCSTQLKFLPSLYSGIWVLSMGKLWQAYLSVQKLKEIITFLWKCNLA